MAKANKLSPLAATVGAAFVASAMSLPVTAQAVENPFAASDLGAGYQLADKHGEKGAEGRCGGDKKGEGSCGADKGDKGEKGAEGKCGEGKCGGAA
ncbi:hypothetical protein B5T_02466 [Alloalcanivorax dieselolei B5]|uniref:Low-complexity protein n=1 Tax=Alcanivorax dieselolei (strain DSM 16502 / CGMCC 1.3690 / MCCC 1A00001 / B-5) TaxID=930169 RepID=K0CB15_ALCDB|nr:hypothetical protein [Alloalcanivorax dieselolei]AFT70739.1 hypothetical protein B5T_02466 [Alloalcanivorax dieselolei B5]GGJ97422.1 hypothetical protein GCM10007426_28070 [Alloalcanivorax dieselolei]